MDEGNGRQLTVIESVGIDPRVPCYIVGIGASAGGLESLESLFKHMPTNSGMAFVVIQHLSPDFKSMMSELLARDTSMRIVVVEDRVRVEANTIYLIPPRKEMIIAEGCLHLSEKDVSRGFTLPIDHFLESLGRELGEASIAIILSGSGSDGTRGIAEVSRRGGLVISESLDTARFDGMPSSAQATGLVDLVLPPAEIGTVLAGYCDDPGSLPRGKLDRQERDSSLKGIDAIIQLFRSVYDIDFASYKDSTVMRRIRRRLAMAQAETFDQYAEILQSNPAELHALYGDLLIGVTQFFRDPEIFRTLCEVVLPEVIMNRKDEDGIRAWVAGCATGEEAYSTAIAFQEAMRVTGRHVPLKLFATDVHKRSIEHASRGCFTEDELHSLNEELYSVNSEHQRKIEELAELNRDMSHLLENTDVATVFLDSELRIRRFTSRVRVVFELPDECVLVNGDRTRLIQVQVNLIHKAAKYSETKAPIRVTMEILPDLIHVSVADDGRGIPSDMLESIFEPFSQLDQSRRNSDGGLGSRADPRQIAD